MANGGPRSPQKVSTTAQEASMRARRCQNDCFAIGCALILTCAPLRPSDGPRRPKSPQISPQDRA
eukprot:5268803-Pyramimonas_sp.AAC.1